jgi:hypothetical protein
LGFFFAFLTLLYLILAVRDFHRLVIKSCVLPYWLVFAFGIVFVIMILYLLNNKQGKIK